MKNNKILFISQYFYPENFKGNDLVFELIRKGYEIVVITGKPNYPKGNFFKGYGFFKRNFEIINGAKLYRLPLIPKGNGGIIKLVLNYFSYYLSSWIFFRFFNIRFDYDIVITQQLSPITSSLPAIWYKKKKNKPLVTWVLDLWPESVVSTTNFKNGFVIDLLEKVAQYLYRESDKILISSLSFTYPIIGRNIPIDKISYFPNWADEVVEKGSFNNRFSLLPTGFNVVFAGNFGEAQDLGNIIKAIIYIGNSTKINFIFVGSGRYEIKFKRQIVEYNLMNVLVFPQHSSEFMPSLYAQASAMLLTLKGGEQISSTVPAKLQTYLSNSKAVLAMIDGEASEIISNAKCGFVSKAGDYQSLASNIIKMSELSIDELMVLEKNAINYYKANFSREIAMNKIEEVINQLI